MATPTCNNKVILLMAAFAVAAALSTTTSRAQLQTNFYANTTCPQAEAIVRNATQAMIMNDRTMGAAFMRLFFHDCFVRGCDASILIDPTSSNRQVEKKAIVLRGYAQVNTIKAAVEAACPGVVSCADILAFAARDTAVVSGGFPAFDMPSGRRDGTVSSFFDVLQNIPSQTFMLQDLISNFAAKGLNVGDLITLSGAHSFGQAHCSAFNGRLYPSVDPTMNATYAAGLRTVCPPPGSSGDPVVNNNRVTDPNVLSNQYYSNLLTGQDLFFSDQQLMNTTDTAAMVASNSADAATWMNQFAAALVKMGNIQVLTGTAGQIRKYCNVVNSS